MSRNQSISPIVRFLGEEAGKGGPFALLGLPHSIQSDDQVRRAQLQRLRQIDSHPHRGTPDAQEVRLAVHSAATQLLDHQLRDQLAIRWPEGSPIDLPKAWRRKGSLHQITPTLMRRARLIVGSSGGWNPIARRRLAHLARVNRLNAIEIVRALGRPSNSGLNQTSRADNAPIPDLPPEPGAGGWLISYTVLGLLACVLLVTVVIDPLSNQRTADAVPSAQPTLRDSRELLPSTVGGNQVERERLTHYTAIAHELDRLVLRASSEPRESMDRFAQVYPQFVDRWTEFPQAGLQRASANIAQFVTRLEQNSVAPEEISSLLAVAGLRPDRVMMASSVIDVVLASPTLSADTRSLLREIRVRLCNAQITPRIEIIPQVQACASSLASESTNDDPEWWEAWLSGAIHATEASAQDRTRLLLEALTTRMNADQLLQEDWEQTSVMLVKALGWRPDSPERFWLIEQFSNSQVSTPRLSILTDAIVTHSAAEGIDPRHVLSSNANDPQRASLAREYERAWFPRKVVSSGGRDAEPHDELTRQLNIAFVSTGNVLSDDQAVDQILKLTNLNTAAELRLQGRIALSEELLQDPPEIRSVQATPIRIAPTQADNDWAERARNAEDAGQLRPYLNELLVDNRIGINSAHALVYLATHRSVQADLRDMATAQLVRYREQLNVLLAIDHALSDSGASSRLDRLVTNVLEIELPNRNAPDWYPTVRRELLTRMASAIGNAQQPEFNSLQSELARLLSLRLSVRDLATQATGDHPDLLLQRLNQRDRIQIESEIARSPSMRQRIEASDAEVAVRSARATSITQRYLANQLHAVSIRSALTRARYPDTAIRLDDLHHDLSQRLRQSSSVVQQIAHCERAIAVLSYTQLVREGSR